MGNVPPELWNRLGTRLLPKLRTGDGFRIRVEMEVEVATDVESALRADIKQAIMDLGLDSTIEVR